MKIICIGRNYAAHAKELGNEAPAEPVVFLKPETALLPKNHPFFLPEHSREVQYELELVVPIHRLGKHIPVEFANRYYDKVGLGIDFTARDTQRELKEKGLPWEIAKAFDHSAPVGKKFMSLEELPNADNIRFELRKNGETVQRGQSADMTFGVDELIAHVSKYFTLKIGDLIFTGTPAGVGTVEIGDRLEGYLEGEKLIDITVK